MNKPLRVLVVEDSEDDTILLMRELRRGGYEPVYERVESAATMETALTRQPWDLVAADYTMPHFNALDALTLLKESGIDLPFIIISGTIGEARAVAAMKAGAHDYLVKGQLARLAPIIEREMREAQMRRERKQAEEALRDRERYFRALIENAADVIMTLDASGQITYASPALVRVLGFTPEEYVSRNVSELPHPDDVEDDMTLFTQLLQQPGGTVASRFRFQHKDGSWRWFEAATSNLLAEPSVQAVVMNLRDVTARKRLEAQFLQAQKMEAIGQLTAGIAHDFNNLLTIIIFNAQFMQMHLQSEDPHYARADTILDASSRAADLIRQLLIFSRKQLTSPGVVKLNEVIMEMSQLLERVIGENIEVRLKLAPDLWSVNVDPTQMEQVVVNLVVNARDAMPDGGKLILETANVVLAAADVAGYIDLPPGEYVLLTVSDTGTGMSRKVQAHLFEPFFTTKGVGKGTGLGLATVYGIVKQRGGHIGVYSEKGKGSSFKIYLPRSQDDGEIAASPSPQNDVRGGDETILVVEDDTAIRKLARDVLHERGYTVLEAENGEDALQVAAGHTGSIDLLLTDVIMTGMSGKALAEKLARQYSQIKVVYMSGYSDEVISHHGILEPGIILLEKPFSLIEMIRKVREVLG